MQRERNRNRKYRRRCRNIAAIARMADTKDSKMQRAGYTENQVIGYDRNVISLTRYTTYTYTYAHTIYTRKFSLDADYYIVDAHKTEVHTYVRIEV